MEQAIALLRKYHADHIAHSRNDLLGHLKGTERILREWGCPEHLCLAGLCHSIYGTEFFPRTTIPVSEREEVRGVIGAPAEQIAYLFCVLDRASLEASLEQEGPPRLIDRHSHEALELSPQQFSDLITLDVANVLEQVPRAPLYFKLMWKGLVRIKPVMRRRALHACRFLPRAAVPAHLALYGLPATRYVEPSPAQGARTPL